MFFKIFITILLFDMAQFQNCSHYLSKYSVLSYQHTNQINKKQEVTKTMNSVFFSSVIL